MSNDPEDASPSFPNSSLPVAVIGGGPIGLVVAAHLVAVGECPVLFEAGSSAGASIREWGHVRLFSPWKYLVDPVAAALLERQGWRRPDGDELPTGREFVENFLDPLGAHPDINRHLHFRRKVIGVSRKGMDKVKGAGREYAPFEIVTRDPGGHTESHLARAIIDASGTWANPNPIGAGGYPVEGERKHRNQIRYGIPDVLGRERDEYKERTTLVVGSGHSAFNTILDLVQLGEDAPDTRVVWAIRREEPGLMFGGGERDALPARGSLGARLKALVDKGQVTLVTGFRIEAVDADLKGKLRIRGAGERVIGSVDRIVANTGHRPDLTLLRELRLELDPWLEAPARVAPMIDPNLHSCGTVYPHGFEELKHPEKGAFVVGMKSYGRAPTFLMLTGYEQVRSVVAGLTGDMDAAREVRLVLPETGVCSTDLSNSNCCASADNGPQPLAGSCGISSACESEVGLVTAATSPANALRSGGCCG